MHPVQTHSLWLQIWVARLSSGEKLNQSLLIQFFFKDRGKMHLEDKRDDITL